MSPYRENFRPNVAVAKPWPVWPKTFAMWLLLNGLFIEVWRLLNPS